MFEIIQIIPVVNENLLEVVLDTDGFPSSIP